jgi:hypothetical protein
MTIQTTSFSLFLSYPRLLKNLGSCGGRGGCNSTYFDPSSVTDRRSEFIYKIRKMDPILTIFFELLPPKGIDIIWWVKLGRHMFCEFIQSL